MSFYGRVETVSTELRPRICSRRRLPRLYPRTTSGNMLSTPLLVGLRVVGTVVGHGDEMGGGGLVVSNVFSFYDASHLLNNHFIICSFKKFSSTDSYFIASQ